MKITFKENWIFYKVGQENKKNEICLPHDAMLGESRSDNNPGGKNVAWHEGADYVYEKSFMLPADYCGKKIVFEFEGVYRNAEIYINGEKAASRPYGYTNFYVNGVNFLNFEKKNHIKVITRNADQPNSRWYSGAGIYRPVWMHVLPQKHIKLDGVKIRTLSIGPAVVEIKVDTEGKGKVCTEIFSGYALIAKGAINSEAGKESVFTFEIKDARLWSPDKPYLYKCKVRFEDDEAEIYFGIRTVLCDAKNGFLLNNERIILRGACVHHDNGLLGAAAYPCAEERKIRILKENGYNAVRSAHNPCSKALLEACDRMGVLVLDEYADMWYIHKTKYDYADHMLEWWRRDLTDMVDKDYNHPSVIMYSIGNEVSETAQKHGIELAGEMIDFLHNIDNTRPVTCCVNIFFNYLSSLGLGVHSNKKAVKAWKAPKKAKAVGSEFFNNLAGVFGGKFMKWGASLRGGDRKTRDVFFKLDIAGYNYGINRYRKDIRKYPGRIILGSETFCADAYKFWELAKAHPALIGDFVWAGMDYLGEVGIGAWVYRDYAQDFIGGAGWLTAGSGRIDITGKPTCESAYTKVAFELDKIRIGVIPVNNAGRKHSPSAWKMSNAIESWSWNGLSGKETKVEVYVRAYCVKLFINGKHSGTKKLKNDCRAVFKVKYYDGEISAAGYDKAGKETAKTSLFTAGNETKLSLFPEHEIVGENELCYVRLTYTDDKGLLKPLSRGIVKVDVTGGKLLALGNACSYNKEGYLNNATDTYYGEALAIIKPEKGIVKISASSPYGETEATIECDRIKADYC